MQDIALCPPSFLFLGTIHDGGKVLRLATGEAVHVNRTFAHPTRAPLTARSLPARRETPRAGMRRGVRAVRRPPRPTPDRYRAAPCPLPQGTRHPSWSR